MFAKHSNYYHYFDSQEIVSEPLKVFRNNFVLRPSLSRISFKCVFTIINRQPSLAVGSVELTVSRFWFINV